MCGRDGQTAAATHLHPRDTVVPALDDLAGAQTEVERLAAVPRRVELAVGAPCDTHVVHLHDAACLCGLAVADGQVLHEEFCRRVPLRDGDVRFCHQVNLSPCERARMTP